MQGGQVRINLICCILHKVLKAHGSPKFIPRLIPSLNVWRLDAVRVSLSLDRRGAEPMGKGLKEQAVRPLLGDY